MHGNRLTMRRRLAWVFWLVGIMMVALVLRLAYVQLWQYEVIAERAEQSWKREIPFIAGRGAIVDRNRVPLVYNISSPTVMAIPSQIGESRQTAQRLAPVLGMDEHRLRALISQRKLMVRLQPHGRKITLSKAAAIRKLNLPGIVVTEDNKRFYPHHTLAAHLLGFTGIDNQGLTGLEKKYDAYLRGFNGSISYYADARGKVLRGTAEQYRPPRNGLQLMLTLDKQIQSFVERELELAMEKHQAAQAMAIVMDPRNGDVLAMSSRPTFEPAAYRMYDEKIYNRNLPIWMTYEPGSTFKIITLAAALEERKLRLSEGFFDGGSVQVAGARLRCWKRSGHGSETMLEVVQNSCNPGFVTMGQRLGKEGLFDYIRKFGFGKKTGIDLYGEENGILFKLSRVGPVELATTSFGQGVSVTPIQQIAAVSAAINGGVLYRPRLAKAWLEPNGERLVRELKPKAIRRVVSERTSAEVRQALESVVALGTGRHAFIEGYRVGGKTGTAQKVIGGRYSSSEYIVSFVGFAPADEPRLIVYVAVDHPKGVQFGGLIAAPIVKNIMQDALHHLRIPKRTQQIERKYVYGDQRMVVVPALTGLSKQEIFEQHIQFLRLETAGKGDKVIHQSPAPGHKVAEGSVVRLYFSR